MTTKLVTAPVGLPVPLAAAIAQAKADGAGMDAEIELKVRGIAGEVENKIKRALIEQTRRVTLDHFPDAIKLIRPPLIAVEYVKYIDADGVQRTLAPQDYLVDSVSEPGYVMPAPGCAWPATADRANAVEVQYRCGYGADHTAVPPPIQTYILGCIEAMYASTPSRNEQFLCGLLNGFKVLV